MKIPIGIVSSSVLMSLFRESRSWVLWSSASSVPFISDMSRPTDWYSITVPEGSKIARSLQRCQRILSIRHDDPVIDGIDRMVRGQRGKKPFQILPVFGRNLRPEPVPDNVLPLKAEIPAVSLIDKDMRPVRPEPADKFRLVLDNVPVPLFAFRKGIDSPDLLNSGPDLCCDRFQGNAGALRDLIERVGGNVQAGSYLVFE